jgi:hypothetical protein
MLALVLNAAGSFVVALIVWRKSAAIASRLSPDEAGPVASSGITNRGLMGIAFSAVGAIIVIQSIGKIDFAVSEMVAQRMLEEPAPFPDESYLRLASYAIQFVLGLWLLLGARGLLNLLHRLRFSPEGEPPAPETAQADEEGIPQ